MLVSDIKLLKKNNNNCAELFIAFLECMLLAYKPSERETNLHKYFKEIDLIPKVWQITSLWKEQRV